MSDMSCTPPGIRKVHTPSGTSKRRTPSSTHKVRTPSGTSKGRGILAIKAVLLIVSDKTFENWYMSLTITFVHRFTLLILCLTINTIVATPAKGIPI
jgi:hypothetical protein